MRGFIYQVTHYQVTTLDLREAEAHSDKHQNNTLGDMRASAPHLALLRRRIEIILPTCQTCLRIVHLCVCKWARSIVSEGRLLCPRNKVRRYTDCAPYSCTVCMYHVCMYVCIWVCFGHVECGRTPRTPATPRTGDRTASSNVGLSSSRSSSCTIMVKSECRR